MVATPEALVPEYRPHIMLTFYDIQSNGIRNRLKVYLKRKNHERKSRRTAQRP